jgi:hypothetical protein
MSHGKRITSHRVGEQVQIGPVTIEVKRITTNRVFLRWRDSADRVSIEALNSEPCEVGPPSAEPMTWAFPEITIP